LLSKFIPFSKIGLSRRGENPSVSEMTSPIKQKSSNPLKSESRSDCEHKRPKKCRRREKKWSRFSNQNKRGEIP